MMQIQGKGGILTKTFIVKKVGIVNRRTVVYTQCNESLSKLQEKSHMTYVLINHTDIYTEDTSGQ